MCVAVGSVTDPGDTLLDSRRAGIFGRLCAMNEYVCEEQPIPTFVESEPELGLDIKLLLEIVLMELRLNEVL